MKAEDKDIKIAIIGGFNEIGSVCSVYAQSQNSKITIVESLEKDRSYKITLNSELLKQAEADKYHAKDGGIKKVRKGGNNRKKKKRRNNK